MQQEIYVSITGLKIKRAWYLPVFWFFAVRSMAQARRAPGNLRAEARKIAGVHHTLSVWSDRTAMRTYLAQGAHLQAMRLYPHIATGKVIGFAAPKAPEWSQVHDIWRAQGRDVGPSQQLTHL